MTDSTDKLTGYVKWFNNQLNYGFITVTTEGKHNGVDVFVHQTNINPQVSNYRTLTQGEYVEFLLTENPTDKHPFHATHVTGIHGYKLMCDYFNPNFRRTNRQGNDREGGHQSRDRGGAVRGGAARAETTTTTN